MPIMRVEKNRNYTVMANYHLKDKEISLKAKGLLSVMLSLPSEWDFTLAGLSYINKEGVDAIRAAVNELVGAGYIVRSRRRNEVGQLTDTEYTIYEFPQKGSRENSICDRISSVSQHPSDYTSFPITPTWEKPMLENPMLDNPMLATPTQDNPMLGKPTLENPMQLSTNQKKKKRKNTDSSNLNQSSIDPSIPDMVGVTLQEEEQSSGPLAAGLPTNQLFQSPIHKLSGDLTEQQKYLSEPSSLPDLRRKLSYQELVRKIKEQIEYWDLINENDKDEINNILSIMIEVMTTKCEYFTISGKKYPADLVHQRYSQINYHTILYVLECMHKCGSNIRNIKQYLIATLFNAPATCDSYYSAAVRRDFEFLRD